MTPHEPVTTNSRITARSVLERETERLKTTPSRLLVSSRKRRLAHRRQDVMLRIYIECPHVSYPHLGKIMNRHHTTILHGVKSAAERRGMTYDDVLTARANNAINGAAS